MNKDEAIKYLQQLYPNGGHCWLDEQRIEAIDMAVKALKEEPVSEELKIELEKYIKGHFTIDTEQLDRFGIEEKDYMYSMDKSDMLALVEHFTNWQKIKEELVGEDYRERYKNITRSDAFKSAYENKSLGEVMSVEGEEPVSEDLGEYINKLSKQSPEVSFAKLSRIAVRVAKWKEQQLMANAVEGVVHHFEKCGVASVHYNDPTGVPMAYFTSPEGLSAGDKVKIITIKKK